MQKWTDLRTLRAWLRVLLAHERFFAGLAAVSALLSVAAAVVSVYLVRQIALDTKLASRPFFSFSRERIDGQPPRLTLEARNVGGRPASDVSVLLLALPTSLTEPLALSDLSESSNVVAQDSFIRIGTTEPLRVSASGSPYYVIVALKYEDPATAERHLQTQVLFWAGVGKDPDLTHTDRTMAAKAIEYVSKELERLR